MKVRTLHQAVKDSCSQLYYRQSMISDYLTCPQMALYRWVLGMEEEEPFFAAVLGTAGHEVIYHMHTRRRYDYKYTELMDMFCRAFGKEIKKLDVLPAIAPKYDSWKEQLAAHAPTYVQMLQGYQSNRINKEFHSTMHEQQFVLVVKDEETGDEYLYTGTLDQGGVYDDGVYAMRDIKFRDDAYRPNRLELDLNIQITVYSAALTYGNPACWECRPKYAEQEYDSIKRALRYDGPCDECKKKIGTPKWPRRVPERCEIVWMRDYLTYQKDQYAKEVVDKTTKVKSAKTGRLVYKRITNPQWVEGYKAGDQRGPGVIKTYRTRESIDILMSDVLRICKDMRDAHFYRSPGSHCVQWCRHNQACKAGIELEIEDADLTDVTTFGTEEPF